MDTPSVPRPRGHRADCRGLHYGDRACQCRPRRQLLARPGGNLTGVNFLSGELTEKRLGVMRELIPGATRFAVLLNALDVANSENTMRDVEAAARATGLQIGFVKVSTSRDIDAAFASFARERPDALLIGTVPTLRRRVQLACWRQRYGI
jgi:ABC-type uncharacterized transport system substrate-binding protein